MATKNKKAVATVSDPGALATMDFGEHAGVGDGIAVIREAASSPQRACGRLICRARAQPRSA